eukprot:5187082-Prymnesium_polylepis.1
MILGPEELKKGGKREQLGSGQPPALAARARATVLAIWLYMYNNGRSSNYRFFKKLLCGPQAKAISRMHCEEFVAQVSSVTVWGSATRLPSPTDLD